MGVFERGRYALALSLLLVGVQFCNLGFHTANTYILTKDFALKEKIFSNNIIVTLVTASIFAVIIYFTKYFFGFENISFNEFLLIILLLPLTLKSYFAQNMLIAIEKMNLYNYSELISKLVFLIVGAIAITYSSKSEYLLAAQAVSAIVLLVYVIKKLDIKYYGIKHTDFNLVKSITPYALKIYSNTLFMFLILKADILMVEKMLGSEETGNYSIASSLGDMLLIFPSILGQVLFTRFVKNEESRFKMILFSKFLVLFVMLPIAITSYFYSSEIIVFLYGEAFIKAAKPFALIAFAVVLLGVNTITSYYYASVKMPKVSVIAPFLVCALNVILNLILIPKQGIEGAALASLISYLALLLINIKYIGFTVLFKKVI